MNVPGNINVQLQTCYAALQAGDLAGAERWYEQISLAHPKNGDAQHLGAIIAHRMGQHPLALLRIDKALNISPTHFEYLNTKGNIAGALQDIPAALKAYSASLKVKPDYLVAAQNLGKYFIDNKDPKRALSVYQNGLQHHPENNLLQIGRVIALKEMMLNEKALAELDAMASGKNYPYVRGQILMQMERYDESVIENRNALAEPSLAANAFKNIMQALWMQGKWGEAQEHIDAYLDKAGHSVAVHAAAARLLDKADDSPAAYAMLAHSVARHGPQPEILAARARFKLQDGDMDAAYTDALAALTARPGDLNLMVDYADGALATGRHEEALHAATEALKVVPNNQFWIAVKATAMRAMGSNHEGHDHRYYMDTDKFVVPFQLEPPEGYESLTEYNTALKATLDEMHGLSEHPLDQSLRNGTQTVQDLRFAKHPILKAHFKALEKPIRAYMKMLGRDETHPLLRRNTGEYLIAGAWSVKLRKKGFHVPHVHPEGWISSAYYVDVPEEVADTEKKAGWIHFGKPPFPVMGADGKELGYEKIVQPKVGTLVLFPSYMWHGTNPLMQDASRMTLPIDVVPI
ncbi:MAG: putative 2OG-Fe(II) oxygenase [Robiginitomaculum sp.]|nr:putative 2OG-Fe(II) oxygenase [Robiginitomaculum sp.]